MFKAWLDNYRELAALTRWMSIIGAVLLAFILVVPIIDTIATIISSESGIIRSVQWIGFRNVFPFLILFLLVTRVAALKIRDGIYDTYASLAWLTVGLVILSLLTIEFVGFKGVPECVPTPESTCFYSFESPQISPFATLIYVLCGCVRFLAIGLAALLRTKSRLK